MVVPLLVMRWEMKHQRLMLPGLPGLRRCTNPLLRLLLSMALLRVLLLVLLRMLPLLPRLSIGSSQEVVVGSTVGLMGSTGLVEWDGMRETRTLQLHRRQQQQQRRRRRRRLLGRLLEGRMWRLGGQRRRQWR